MDSGCTCECRWLFVFLLRPCYKLTNSRGWKSEDGIRNREQKILTEYTSDCPSPHLGFVLGGKVRRQRHVPETDVALVVVIPELFFTGKN